VLAQVLRDEWGHSLGLGIVHMGSPEDVERVFNEHQRLEVSGSRVDLWEPAEQNDPQAERVVVFTPRAVNTEQDAEHMKSKTSARPQTVLLRRLVEPLMSSAGGHKP
jgi:hypothetical protein